jgi:hypothetical protein
MQRTYIKKFVLILTAYSFQVYSLLCQGSFENLDFDSANIPSGTAAGTLVPASEALPFWMVYVDGVQQSQVLYNSLYIGTATVALVGPGSTAGGVIPGNTYTAVLQSGQGTSGLVSASIAQSGTIPASTQSLLFESSLQYGAGWYVSIGGQNIAVTPLASLGSFYELYGANIPGFAGQAAQLEFTALAGPGPMVNMYLDDIQFSTQAIPEPQTWTLLFCGAGALSLWRWKRKALVHQRATSIKGSPIGIGVKRRNVCSPVEMVNGWGILPTRNLPVM